MCHQSIVSHSQGGVQLHVLRHRLIALCSETLVECRVGSPLSSAALEVRMSTLDLRPLSIGEILDRTFSLYRRNFLLFIGISALPQLLVLALRLVQVAIMPTKTAVVPPPSAEFQGVCPFFSVAGVVGIIGL